MSGSDLHSPQVGRSITTTRSHRCCVVSVVRTTHSLIISDSFTAGHEQCWLLTSSAMVVWTFSSEIYDICSGWAVVSLHTFKFSLNIRKAIAEWRSTRGTAIQAGRFRVRFPMVSLEFLLIQSFWKRLRFFRGSVLTFSTQVCGFKPGRCRRIFSAKKSSARLPSEGK